MVIQKTLQIASVSGFSSAPAVESSRCPPRWEKKKTNEIMTCLQAYKEAGSHDSRRRNQALTPSRQSSLPRFARPSIRPVGDGPNNSGVLEVPAGTAAPESGTPVSSPSSFTSSSQNYSPIASWLPSPPSLVLASSSSAPSSSDP